MAEMEDRLNSILGNPQMMQQIMAMAQALGQTQGGPPKQEESKSEPPPQQSQMPSGNELAAMQKLFGMARQSGIDKNQQNLLKALGPYLSRERIAKLEKAMRAAKMAGLASTVLGNSGLSFLSGR